MSHSSNPHQVQAVLLNVAADNPDVLKTPEPVVTLDEFSLVSINFTLYAFIGDINNAVLRKRAHNVSTFMAVLPVFPPRWHAGFIVVDANYSTSEWFNLKTTKALGLNVPLNLQQLADVVIE
jgi:small-conductance mechanosensitive channel